LVDFMVWSAGSTAAADFMAAALRSVAAVAAEGAVTAVADIANL
jgi:hypothetical protein